MPPSGRSGPPGSYSARRVSRDSLPPPQVPCIASWCGELKAVGSAAKDSWNFWSDARPGRASDGYDMHTLPTEIEDARLEGVVADGSYLDATREVLSARGGLWFYDESFVVSRRRD